jgi:TPR repeat protein
MYLKGVGIKADINRATYWLERASLSGMIEADSILNHLVKKGALSIGLPNNVSQL